MRVGKGRGRICGGSGGLFKWKALIAKKPNLAKQVFGSLFDLSAAEDSTKVKDTEPDRDDSGGVIYVDIDTSHCNFDRTQAAEGSPVYVASAAVPAISFGGENGQWQSLGSGQISAVGPQGFRFLLHRIHASTLDAQGKEATPSTAEELLSESTKYNWQVRTKGSIVITRLPNLFWQVNWVGATGMSAGVTAPGQSGWAMHVDKTSEQQFVSGGALEGLDSLQADDVPVYNRPSFKLTVDTSACAYESRYGAHGYAPQLTAHESSTNGQYK